jgi:ribbon-helix-helix CopG family protein
MSLEVQKQHVTSNAGSGHRPFTGKGGEIIMGKYKKDPKYNVVSIRVNDEEKAFLDEMTQRDRTTVTKLMREAIRHYIPHVTELQEQR